MERLRRGLVAALAVALLVMGPGVGSVAAGVRAAAEGCTPGEYNLAARTQTDCDASLSGPATLELSTCPHLTSYLCSQSFALSLSINRSINCDEGCIPSLSWSATNGKQYIRFTLSPGNYWGTSPTKSVVQHLYILLPYPGLPSRFTLVMTASGGSGLNNIYYAVVRIAVTIKPTVEPPPSVLEGKVLEDNVINPEVGLAIAGAKVDVTGPDGFSTTVATTNGGSYQTKVPSPGDYTVTPAIPNAFWLGSGAPKPSDPPSRTVSVTKGATVEADFKVPSTMRLELNVAPGSVPADGFSYATVTVKSLNAGRPAPGVTFSLRPFGGGSVLTSAWDMPVPATICGLDGDRLTGRVWPKVESEPTTNAVDVTTDAAGESTLRVYAGTVPGDFPLRAWLETSTGGLVTQNVEDVSPDATVTIAKLDPGVDPRRSLQSYLDSHHGAADELPTVSSNTPPSGAYIDIARALAQLVSARDLPGFAFAPVTDGTSSAVLVTPDSVRLQVNGKTGVITIPAANPAWVISPFALNGVTLYAGGFWGALQLDKAVLPTVGEWQAAKAPGYAFSAASAPITVPGGTSAFNYLGFGYTSCN